MRGSEAGPEPAVLRSTDEARAPRVFIVEDHELLAQSVGLALEGEGCAVRLSELEGDPVMLMCGNPDGDGDGQKREPEHQHSRLAPPEGRQSKRMRFSLQQRDLV